ncbi:MAG: nuclear transport factor 2 family protein, partial [Clostridia bacterium]|nr:nuclear transport factor 2 family protein [Clostridia bacterium]
MRAELKEYQAVEAAAKKFVKSVAEGNSKYARALFTDEAVLFGYLDGKLEHGSIEQFYHNVDTIDGGENFKARIDVVA